MNIRKQLELYYWVKQWLELEDSIDQMNKSEWTFQVQKVTRKVRQIVAYIDDERTQNPVQVEPAGIVINNLSTITMKESGKVVYIGTKRTGMNARTGNEWASQDFVIETNERYPRKIAFTIMGSENIDKANLALGETIEVVGFSESHEYNGQWYTENRCTDILQNNYSRFVARML